MVRHFEVEGGAVPGVVVNVAAVYCEHGVGGYLVGGIFRHARETCGWEVLVVVGVKYQPGIWVADIIFAVDFIVIGEILVVGERR